MSKYKNEVLKVKSQLKEKFPQTVNAKIRTLPLVFWKMLLLLLLLLLTNISTG